MRPIVRRRGQPPLSADRSGNVMLEFALGLPVLALLVVGLLDLGRYSLQKSAMLQGARAGAQYGILDYSSATNVNTTAQNRTLGDSVVAEQCLTTMYRWPKETGVFADKFSSVTKSPQ